MNEASGSGASIGGHPRGLVYLGATELWERFSYYGMAALLSLYMVQQLLLPGHAEHVIGLAALRDLFEFRGAMSDRALASLIYGWYAGLVYFTPLIGGWIADRWLGARKTVVIGALLMSAGHLAMTFDATFLIALLLLILGSGCLKGNIAAQIGRLYPDDEESRRARGFAIFSTAINVGALAGPLATGAARAAWGWHAGFGIAAALMLVALAIYLAGQRHLPEERRERVVRETHPPLDADERRRTLALVVLFALIMPIYLAYSMIWNIGLIWIDERVSLVTPLGRVPASWFNSVDAFGSIFVAAPLVALWAWQAKRRREPASVAKVAIGAAIAGASALLLAAGSLFPDAGGNVSVLWPLAAYFGMGVAFMWYWPVVLAVASRAAPTKINATMMGTAYLTLFFATVAMGWVGSFYDRMSDTAFWTLDAGIAFGGALIAMLIRKPLSRALQLPSAS